MSRNVDAELVGALCVQACWMRLPSGPSSRAYTLTVSAGRPVCSPQAHVRISRGRAREGMASSPVCCSHACGNHATLGDCKTVCNKSRRRTEAGLVRRQRNS